MSRIIEELDIEHVAEVIGTPIDRWPGNCYAIAADMLHHKLIAGFTRYGLYHGFIDDDSPMFGGRSFARHAWAVQKDAIGTDCEIVDPTRWVFENADPYIYIGPDSDDYDLGGAFLRRSIGIPEPPPFDENEQHYPLLDLNEDAVHLIGLLLVDAPLSVCMSQMFWLANLPPQTFGTSTPAIYEWFERNDLSALIPIDFRNEVANAWGESHRAG